MAPDRSKHVERFCELLKELEERLGGKRTLDEFTTGIAPSIKGVYFFFEPGEYRQDRYGDLRVVRVGTHTGNHSTLGARLFEHKVDGGRSVFRDHINAALKNRSKARNSRQSDHRHASCISTYIEKMSFLWLRVDDLSTRKYIERTAVSLLSNWNREPIDKPSRNWLGWFREDPCNPNRNHKKIAKSGLWNIHFTTLRKDPNRLFDVLSSRIDRTPKPTNGRDERPCL